MNKELFEKIKAAVREEPKRLDMSVWRIRAEWGSGDNINPIIIEDFPACGTVGCIAGWALTLKETGGDTSTEAIKALAFRKTSGHDYIIRGANALGLLLEDARALFHSTYWPTELQYRLVQLDPGTPKYAEVICDAIDAFMAHPETFHQASIS